MEAEKHTGEQVTINVPAGNYKLGRPPLRPVLAAFDFYSLDPSGAANGDLDILGPMTIVGAGAGQTVIDGGRLDRIFNVHSGLPAAATVPAPIPLGPPVTISDMTLTGGDAAQREVLTMLTGGAILNAGTLTVQRVSLIGNHARVAGGAIFNIGYLSVRESTVA